MQYMQVGYSVIQEFESELIFACCTYMASIQCWMTITHQFQKEEDFYAGKTECRRSRFQRSESE